jgi:hypothetical protein
MLLTLAILGAIGTGLGLKFGYFDRADISKLGTDINDKANGFLNQILVTDPFSGLNGTLYLWVGASGKGGLNLEILNALSSDWQDYYTAAISDWESGSPDALTLTTTVITPESACDAVDGVMKVCNGDYGDTGWRGINEFLTNGLSRIVSSSAKMNEFYLASSDSDERRYTMCHEVGHGFGLPHTDENFYNPVLGNCLDYTEVNKDKNLSPGQVNFDKLVGMYGVVGGRRLGKGTAPSDGQHETEHMAAPAWVRDELKRKMRHLESKLERAHEEGWVLMQQNDFGQYHMVDLGEGYQAHANVLLAAAPQN